MSAGRRLSGSDLCIRWGRGAGNDFQGIERGQETAVQEAGAGRAGSGQSSVSRWEGVGAGARALLGHGSVRYLLDSTIYVDTPLGDRRIMIQTRGEVPLRDLVR